MPVPAPTYPTHVEEPHGSNAPLPSRNEPVPQWLEYRPTSAPLARSIPLEADLEWQKNAFLEMVRVRAVDEALFNLAKLGKIGVYTPIAGQEAAQVGAALALVAEDWMVPTFRDLGIQLCRGESLARLILFHMGFEEGSVSGHNNLPLAAPVASQLPHAVGLAWALSLEKRHAAVLACLGDGATSKGDFHEAVNMAAVVKAPVVFFCQNNQWALSTPLSQQTAEGVVAKKAMAYGISGLRVEGGDLLSVYAATRAALQRARDGGGPCIVECLTERRGPHSAADDPKLYQNATTHVPKIPGAVAREWLYATGTVHQDMEAAVEKAAHDDVHAAWEEASRQASHLRQSRMRPFVQVYADEPPELDAQMQHAQAGNFGDPSYTTGEAVAAPKPVSTRGAKQTMVQAINRTLVEVLEGNAKAIICGQDVGPLGGVFRVTKGLFEKFGCHRVVNTPLSESGVMGAAIGLALAGWRPICEIQFAGFIYPAFDQLCSHAARFRSRSNGQLTVPLVVRAPYGTCVGAPENHSDSVEMLFARTPGIKVVIPSSPSRARRLLLAAIADPDPVVILEPIALYRTVKEPVDITLAPLPLGRALRLREGGDITLISYGAMLRRTEKAADTLAEQGIAAEVIDLVSLSPLDMATIIDSTRKTKRLLVIHEGARTGDIGAEIAARLHASLDGMPFAFDRVCGWDVVPPFHGREDCFVPGADDIVQAALRLLG